MGDPLSRGHTRMDPFVKAMSVSVAILIALISVVVGLASFQGPKLSAGQIDVDQAVKDPNTQLRLFANQVLAGVKPDQVTVSPAVPFSVSRTDDVLVIQFEERLAHDTEYTVKAKAIKSLYRDSESTFEYSFETKPAVVHYLDRADPAVAGGEDSIVRVSLDGSSQEDVYSAPRIQEFAMVGDVIAVTTADEADRMSLHMVNPADGVTDQLDLPTEIQSIGGLRSNSDGTFLAFSAAPAGENLLFAIDLNGSREATAVLGIDGTPVQILDWLLPPNGNDVIVQASNLSISRIDLTGTAPVEPIGQFEGLESVSLDGSQLVVRDLFGLISLTLADRKEERFSASPLFDVDPLAGDVILIGEKFARVQKVAIFDEASGRFSSYIALDRDGTSQVLLENPSQLGSLGAFSVSPNGQYLAAAVIPNVAASVPDQYPVRSESTSVTTVIVEIESGLIRGSMTGFQLDWNN